ncbi:MAG: iron-containing alcohol dehydrogenase, partial [Acidobacteriota bacterium]|nr:iron-containing alcohol dehydrogenase [Acidobacteriota bacterium]
MMRFDFATAQRILFGEGVVKDVPAAARGFGRRAILVRGGSGDRAAVLRPAIEAAGVECREFAVPAEPTVDLIRAAPRDADLVVALGGGSVLDAGKAVAALIANPGDPMDYLEVIGRG